MGICKVLITPIILILSLSNLYRYRWASFKESSINKPKYSFVNNSDKNTLSPSYSRVEERKRGIVSVEKNHPINEFRTQKAIAELNMKSQMSPCYFNINEKFEHKDKDFIKSSYQSKTSNQKVISSRNGFINSSS
jgi:hypothetical protein